MRPSHIVLSLLLACSLPASALDITGIVLDKIDQPIPSARICLKNSPSRCVTAGVNGVFRITDADVVAAGPALATLPYSLELLGTRLAVTVPRGPEAGQPSEIHKARIAWRDASGRSLAPERRVDLRPGRNLLALPDLPRAGLHFVQIDLPGITLSWKVLLLGGAVSGAGSAPGRPLAALSKASAALSDLVVTKTGFKPATYRPLQEVEDDAYIILTPLSDSGIVYSSSFKSKSALDRDKGLWITEDTVAECNGTAAVEVVVRDTSRYAVRDGRLYQYYQGQCRGELLTGENPDVVGAWTLSESDVFLPADLRPAACKDTALSTPVPESVKGVVTISETEQAFEISAEVCPPDLFLEIIARALLTDRTVELIRNTCRHVAFRNGAGEEATLDFTKQGDSLFSVFTFGSQVCRTSEMTRQGDDVPIDCVSDDPIPAFVDCMGGTEYFGGPGPAPLPKSAFKTPGAVPVKPVLPGSGRLPGSRAASRWLNRFPPKVYISHP